jgi:CPA1 family monovalent cation:H+ antiporter
MDLFTLITLLITVAAFFAYLNLNTRWLKLPDAILIL